MNSREPAMRDGSALVTALALLIVVSIVCLGVVLQFARWRQNYQLEADKTEQRLVQSSDAVQNTDVAEQDRQNGDSLPQKQK